jgi:hypothetical protein
MKKKTTIVVAAKGEAWRQTVYPTIEGYDPGVDGLTVHRMIRYDRGTDTWGVCPDGWWCVTHWSGYSIGKAFDTRGGAVAYCQGLAKMVDWTKTDVEIYDEFRQSRDFARVFREAQVRLAKENGGFTS